MAERQVGEKMFTRLSRTDADLHDLQRVETLARYRFGLDDDDLLLVSEDRGRQAGEPEKASTITFWKGSERYRVRIFKPVAALSEDDFPAPWLVGALKDDGDADCC